MYMVEFSLCVESLSLLLQSFQYLPILKNAYYEWKCLCSVYLCPLAFFSYLGSLKRAFEGFLQTALESCKVEHKSMILFHLLFNKI